MARICHRTGPNGEDIEYPCPTTRVINDAGVFSVTIEDAHPELAAELAKQLHGGTKMNAEPTQGGLAYTVEGLNASAAASVLAPLSPSRSMRSAEEFLDRLTPNSSGQFDVE